IPMTDEIKNNNINNNEANADTFAEATEFADNLNNKNTKVKDEVSELKEKLSKCEKERDEYLAGWQRARADFSNYKKDEALRFGEFSKYAIEKLVLDLIPVLDSFDLGIAAMEKSGNVDKGVYMIRAQLEDILKNYGLKKINVEIGKELNPEIAEPIIEVEHDGPAGIILEEIEAGYKLYDKVIRPARVKVSKQKNL
ncbi:MAG: nucleotide exchange factor GrpE, partial [Minisyncoccia bacterium]